MKKVIDRTLKFQEEAHFILSKVESAKSRSVILNDTYKKLSGLSIAQDDLMRQALRCVENALFRAAYILAWVTFIDFIQEKLASDGFVKLNAVRPKWRITSIEELREIVEFQIIEACKDVKLISNTRMRIIQGYLSTRNECAHPSDFFPNYNQTLGYISDILNQMEGLQKKKY